MLTTNKLQNHVKDNADILEHYILNLLITYELLEETMKVHLRKIISKKWNNYTCIYNLICQSKNFIRDFTKFETTKTQKE